MNGHPSPTRPTVDVNETLTDGRYSIRREIGRGGACVVFEAVHRLTKRLVALKQLLEPHRANPILRERLLREAEAIAAVRHPNIVEVLDAGELADGAPYIVLERLEGRSLEGLIAARGALRPRDALWTVRQMCAAVAAVHDAGLLHRDLKPSNVLVLGGSHQESLHGTRIKLLDFGIVSAVRFDEVRKLTKDNVVLGTLEYMPPERVIGAPGNGDATGDIYGLGATLFECLTGRAPYDGNALEIVAQLAMAPPPSARSIRPDVPSALEPILEKALHRDAAARYQNARELGRAIGAALDALPSEGALSDAAHAPGKGVPAESRRRHVRAPYITPVRLDHDKRAIDGRTEDLSANGVMVLLTDMPAQGARVQVRFALPTTGQYVTSKAVVRWTRAQSDQRAQNRLRCAAGLEFEALDPHVRAAIEQFVRIVGTDEEPRF